MSTTLRPFVTPKSVRVLTRPDQIGLWVDETAHVMQHALAGPPFNWSSWEAVRDDDEGPGKYGMTCRSTWRTFLEIQKRTGLGYTMLLIGQTESHDELLLGYANMVIVEEESLQCLKPVNARWPESIPTPKVGDAWLTFAGLRPECHGARMEEDGTYLAPPTGGFPRGNRPGVGLYEFMFKSRLDAAYAQTSSRRPCYCWLRTHPEQPRVVKTAVEKFGFVLQDETVGIPQAGKAEEPKVILTKVLD